MKKVWIVLKTEFINTITRRSFLILMILVPLVPGLILGGISLFGGDEGEGGGIDSLFQSEQSTQIMEGIVDQAGIISDIPDWVGSERFKAYQSVASARDAVISGEITGYYLIQQDYMDSGAIRYVREDFNPLTGLDTTDLINYVIRYNLLGSDPQKFEAYQNPILVERIDLAPEEIERGRDNPMAFYLPYGVAMFFYIIIFTSARLMLNSVSREKENRVMEILISSLKPDQLFTGKILGLGLVSLLQMVFWMGSAMLMLRLGGATLNIPPYLQLPPEILIWGVLFFILGYLLYATLMAGIGALVPNFREATQAIFILIIPILIPFMLADAIITEPNGTLATVLSMIPFTAPNTIMTRLAAGSMPIWQLLLSIGLLILTITLLIHAVSNMFRAQLLLTGKKISLGLFLRALFGRNMEMTEGSK